MSQKRIITLTTDFGESDAYVACMKGVILTIAPDSQIVDISHEVPPQSVAAGSYLLEAACPYFPADTIHVGVVDPGVGTSRRGIAVAAPRGIFVGPDNGLFAGALLAQDAFDAASGRLLAGRAVELTNPALRLPQVSATFHGRDIFAPAAAHLALGVALESFGPAVTHLENSPIPPLLIRGAVLRGTIRHVDRFGNAITNIPAGKLPPNPEIRAGGLTLSGLARTYRDDGVVALIGSGGYLEIAVRDGSAAATLGLQTGDRVYVRPES